MFGFHSVVVCSLARSVVTLVTFFRLQLASGTALRRYIERCADEPKYKSPSDGDYHKHADNSKYRTDRREDSSSRYRHDSKGETTHRHSSKAESTHKHDSKSESRYDSRDEQKHVSLERDNSKRREDSRDDKTRDQKENRYGT